MLSLFSLVWFWSIKDWSNWVLLPDYHLKHADEMFLFLLLRYFNTFKLQYITFFFFFLQRPQYLKPAAGTVVFAWSIRCVRLTTVERLGMSLMLFCTSSSVTSTTVQCSSSRGRGFAPFSVTHGWSCIRTTYVHYNWCCFCDSRM